MTDVKVDDKAVFIFLNDPAGPVGRFLEELSQRAAEVARRLVHVRKTPTRSPRSTAFPPGYTLESIGPDMYTDAGGRIYGGVSAAFFPTMYLEEPAEQMHRQYPFLSTAIDSLQAMLLWPAR